MSRQTPEQDAQHMRRAIRLAMNGRGRVEPNPMVGCVIVKHGRVIGEGYHQQFGGPHAEPNALAACTESPEGATVYTTLEPCCHVGKKTPPCVPQLIDAKVRRVVVGCIDPDPSVNGRGNDQLRAAGIEVVAPVLEMECKQLLAPFIARVVHKRPYVTLKWAETADGKVGFETEPVVISNAASGRVVHELRSRCDVIVVGSNTVLVDDPLLTPRGVAITRPLLRVVIDRRLRTPLSSRLVKTAEETPLRLYTTREAAKDNWWTVGQMIRKGVDVRTTPAIDQVLADLYEGGATHVLVEPGPTIGHDWFNRSGKTIDRVWVIRSTRELGPRGVDAPKLPDRYVSVGRLDLDSDVLAEYLNPASPVYFAPESSADLVWAADFTASAGD